MLFETALSQGQSPPHSTVYSLVEKCEMAAIEDSGDIMMTNNASLAGVKQDIANLWKLSTNLQIIF